MTEYVKTSWTTTTDMAEVDLFTSIYLPFGMEWTEKNIDEHGKTFFALRRPFSGGWTRELPRITYRNGGAAERQVEMPAEWIALAEDSLQPIHPRVALRPARMVTVISHDGEAVSVCEETAQRWTSEGVAKEERCARPKKTY